MAKRIATPILAGLLASGQVYAEGYLYTGIASDGARLTLPGSIERPDQAEAYLADFPTPDMW